jgi:hypothetical protein
VTEKVEKERAFAMEEDLLNPGAPRE